MAPIIRDATGLARYLKDLHKRRSDAKKAGKARKQKRKPLSMVERRLVLQKTGGLCHVCGGRLPLARMRADHLRPFALDGSDSIDNFLPAHGGCNGQRWWFSPKEFRLILKLGVWFRTRIEEKDRRALELAERFIRSGRRGAQGFTT